MKQPTPVDNFTDSDDDDLCVIDSPKFVKLPTPPKKSKGAAQVKKNKPNLYIDTDADTTDGNDTDECCCTDCIPFGFIDTVFQFKYLLRF